MVREEKEGSAVNPIVIADDIEMLSSSPEAADFTVSEKAMHAPHRHSKHAPHHAPATPATAGGDKGRKRARPRGGRRSDLQDEIRFQLEEGLDDMEIESDRDTVSPSPAASHASRMLSRPTSGLCVKEAQPAATLSRRESSQRVPMLKNEGKKRACAMSISPAPAALWGEVS